jgi:hypothetical protein
MAFTIKRRAFWLRDYRQHLLRIQEAGIQWVRMDAKRPLSQSKEVFKEAHDLNLNVLCVITSRNMLSGLGFGTSNYFPGSGWNDKWKTKVRSAVEKLGDYVKIWQMDNELNHPGHNFLPWLNKGLAVDIVENGIDAVREIDSEGKIAVNLFFKRRTFIPGLYLPNDRSLILKYKEKLGDRIDLLGMDIYRGTWHSGTPASYHDDINSYHDLWGGDVMIMETGYCLESLGHTPRGQGEHVEKVFEAIRAHASGSPWFSGMFWYEYRSKHEGLPCEEFFGLHTNNGIIEKPAWEEFSKKVMEFNQYNKIFGITYHY